MEIAPGVYDVAPPKRGYLKAGFSKAVIVDSGDGLIVIDTLYDADAGDILDEIKRIGKTPADIKHIVLTHAHRGHLGGLATLKRLSGAPTYAHPWEADIISGDRGRQEPSFFVFTPIQTYPIIFFGRLTSAFTKHEPLAVDHMIGDGDKIGPLQVVHTPGHTPGHLVLYWPERRVLITGDAFVTWPMHCYGWPNSMLNHKQSWESLIKMAELDAEVLSPGHGDSIRQNGAAVLRNMVARERGSMARIKEYWLQLENHPWDAAPWGANRLTGRPLTQRPDGLYRPTSREVLVIRRTTPDWAAPDDRPLNPWDLTEPDPTGAHGTLPGATLRAKVADEIIVHFRNMDQRNGVADLSRVHSLHPHGAQSAAGHNGAFPLAAPDPAQGNRRGDHVAPGESFTYRWSCPHRAAAGAWLYHDGGPDGLANTAAGAFGVLIIQAPGEQEPDAPPHPVRQAADTYVRFAAVPPPPKRAEAILAFHELPGVGLCLNGRAGLGNTPALVVGHETRLTVRCLNATTAPLTVTIAGHRWEHGHAYTDVELLPPGGGATLSILAGSAEGGGGPGEWLVSGRSGNLSVSGSLVATAGGPVELLSA